MKVLVACEESQAVCKAFRKRGHDAYSCDIMECSGGHPEWHIKQDVLPLLNGRCEFTTCDGKLHTISGKRQRERKKAVASGITAIIKIIGYTVLKLRLG